MTNHVGALALLGGGEWRESCRDFDRALLTAAGADEVVVLPSAAAFEHPRGVVERAAAYFEQLGVSIRPLMVLRRADAEAPDAVEAMHQARMIYVADGSPLHLRSVLKGSALWDAMVAAYHRGATLAVSGAGATLVGDPMVDPRGGAYTVGLGLVPNLAVFPYHSSAAGHLLDRSIDLLPATAMLVGIDEETALIRDPAGEWRVAGRGEVTLYPSRETVGRETIGRGAGAVVPELAT